MARKSRDKDLLMEDELTAAFLDDDITSMGAPSSQPASPQPSNDNSDEDEWDEDEPVSGQLAVDVYETKEKTSCKGSNSWR
jgi:HSP20 family protein